MKHSDFATAVQSLAESLLAPDASSNVTLLNTSPVLSSTNPALIFRIALSAPAGHTAEEIITHLAGKVGVTGDANSLPVLRAVERSLASAMNAHRPWSELGLGMAHIVSGSVAIAADPDWLLFDYRFSPTSYEPDA